MAVFWAGIVCQFLFSPRKVFSLAVSVTDLQNFTWCLFFLLLDSDFLNDVTGRGGGSVIQYASHAQRL